MTRTITGPEELKALVGEELGVSPWCTVGQPEVDAFARVAHDATALGGTTVPPLLVLSLCAGLGFEIYEFEGFPVSLNYGNGKVSFPAPVPVGSRVRMRAHLTAVEEVPGGVQVTVTQTSEREGSAEPVCVAESITRLFTAAGG